MSVRVGSLAKMSDNVYPVPAPLSIILIEATFLPLSSLLSLAQLLLLHLHLGHSLLLLLVISNTAPRLQVITDTGHSLRLIGQKCVNILSHPLEQRICHGHPQVLI